MPDAGYITSAQAQAYTGASAMNQVRQIAGLQAAGAKTIVVLNLPDIGLAPNFTNAALFPTQASPAAAAALSGLTFVNNTTLNAGIATLGDGIVPINVYALFNEILADPSAYGFTNTTSTACNLALTGGSSLFCTPAAYRTPDANETYVFADGVHPSGACPQDAGFGRGLHAQGAGPGVDGRRTAVADVRRSQQRDQQPDLRHAQRRARPGRVQPLRQHRLQPDGLQGDRHHQPDGQ